MEEQIEYSYGLRIPKERVAVLIGKSGRTKKHIEQLTKTKIAVDSKEGDVALSGREAIELYMAREIVRAIGRGFNPDIAQLLLKQDYSFEIVSLADYSGTKKALIRLRGRVIGEDGKARKTIEAVTETHISVFGKTIGIIGKVENASLARQAVEALIKGKSHSSVYQWLEKRRKELKRKEFE